MSFLSWFQVILTQLHGQEIQFELFDKDIDQDDFLGRYTSIKIKLLEACNSFWLILIFVGSSWAYGTSSTDSSLIRCTREVLTDHIFLNICVAMLIFLCCPHCSGTRLMTWSQDEFTWCSSGCPESLTSSDWSRSNSVFFYSIYLKIWWLLLWFLTFLLNGNKKIYF